MPPDLDEDFWEDLLTLIEDGKVIPVIGAGVVTRGDDQALFYPWLARRLAERLAIPVETATSTTSLNDVATAHLLNRGDYNALYTRLARILRDECPAPGQALLDLASISAFNLYLTTTFDPLLQKALDSVRHGGAGATAVHAFSPGAKTKDLDARRRDLPGTTVFHLLGRVSSMPEYVVWEEDMLEFILALNRHMPVMEALGRDLKEHGLLFLGLHFSDWLVRFFLRVSKQEPLSTPRVHRAYLADHPDDFSPPSLVLFFGAVSRDIHVMQQDPVAFCAELAQRWKARHPEEERNAKAQLPAAPPEMPRGAIFVSYAREDEGAAASVVRGLQAAGCIVWYDRDRLQAGQQWHNSLEDEVKRRCGLFLSLISRTTEAARESYYHLERNWAASRAELFARDEEFYIPVVIDDSPLPTLREPRIFHQIQATQFPGGAIAPAFAERLVGLQRKAMGAPRMSTTPAIPGSSVTPESPWLGLRSFTEEAQSFFFGRSAELDDLYERVIDKPLAILFGQSGLSKSSLLQAALIPRLRAMGFLPVFIRLDHDPDAPPLEPQVLVSLLLALESAAHPEQAAALLPTLANESPAQDHAASLWLLFHDPAQGLIPPRGMPTDGFPRIVFLIDQFEEIFTLGERPPRRTASAAFRETLADLVENRPPSSLRARLEEDDALAERLDHKAQHSRVLLSLREDFLHLLERWRRSMPSLMENRLELRMLNGPQAFDAVVRPGRLRPGRPAIIADPVGEAIVRFVAGAGDDVPLDEIDAVPPLLSLVCAELNAERLEAGQPQITQAQFEGHGSDILAGFYHRSFDLATYGSALDGVPDAGVALKNLRRFVEDRLLSPDGFRESIAFDTIARDLSQRADPDVSRAVLDGLVERRLLTVEERGGVRRIELAHDVLAPIVKTCRDERHEIEAVERARLEQERAEAETARALKERKRLKRLRRRVIKASTGLNVALRQARQNAYIAHINLAQREWDNAYVVHARELLENPDGAEFRGFEWYYLKRLYFPELLTLKGHTDCVLGVSFSPDGTRLASASSDKTVKLWDAATGQELLTLTGHGGTVLGVSFSPDGKRLASASYDGTVKLWNSVTGEELHSLEGHFRWVASVSFSPDGTRLASASWDESIKVWNTVTGQELLTLKGHRSSVRSVSYSPRGTRLASASYDGTVKLWNATTAQELRTFKGHTHWVNGVSFSPDGTRLASASDDQTVKLWDVATGQELVTLKAHTNWVNGLSFSPDGNRLAFASGDKTVKLWDGPTREVLLTLKGHASAVFCVSFSPDGERIASGGNDHTVKLWDAASRRDMITLQGHTSNVNRVSFSPDGKRLASASGDETVKLWDAATGQELLTLKGHTSDVHDVSFSPDGECIASAGDETVKLWHGAADREMLTLKGHTNYVWGLSFSPDGTRLASAGGDEVVKLWNAATGQELLTLEGHTHLVNGVSFSPDGTRLASVSDDETVKLWDVATGRELLTLKGHSSYVNDVSFNPDGTRLASASSDGTVKLWDAATGRELFTLKGHTDSVNGVCFSPNGTRLASASDDQTVKLWDAATGQELLTLKEHTGYVNGVSFSPDGTRLASASDDQTVKIWLGE